VLIYLYEHLTGKRVGKYSHTPKTVAQKINNLTVVFNAMKKDGIRFAEDVRYVKGKEIRRSFERVIH
jgi:hypothetical protein